MNNADIILQELMNIKSDVGEIKGRVDGIDKKIDAISTNLIPKVEGLVKWKDGVQSVQRFVVYGIGISLTIGGIVIIF